MPGEYYDRRRAQRAHSAMSGALRQKKKA